MRSGFELDAKAPSSFLKTPTTLQQVLRLSSQKVLVRRYSFLHATEIPLKAMPYVGHRTVSSSEPTAWLGWCEISSHLRSLPLTQHLQLPMPVSWNCLQQARQHISLSSVFASDPKALSAAIPIHQR